MARKIKISNKTRRTRTDLQQASKHLCWQMRYLSGRFEFLLRHASSKQEGEIGGILFSINDSFLIHARKLVDFLYNEANEIYDDDVLAEDYFDSPPQWRNLRPEQGEIIRKTKADIGKLLAHLTYSLVDHYDGRITWKVSDVYVEIFQTLQIFLREVDPSLLDSSVDQLRENSPKIVICYPIYPPDARAPYQIMSIRDMALDYEIQED